MGLTATPAFASSVPVLTVVIDELTLGSNINNNTAEYTYKIRVLPLVQNDNTPGDLLTITLTLGGVNLFTGTVSGGGITWGSTTTASATGTRAAGTRGQQAQGTIQVGVAAGTQPAALAGKLTLTVKATNAAQGQSPNVASATV